MLPWEWFYRVDLCHQANDEDDDDEENSTQQALLDNMKSKSGTQNTDGRRRCCTFHSVHVGSRQKFVIVVWEIEVFCWYFFIISSVLVFLSFFLISYDFFSISFGRFLS